MMPQSVKMFFCDEFLEIIKHDFATEALSSNWFVWYEIKEYDMHLGIKKTRNAINYTNDGDAFDDDECKLVYKIIDYHQKNNFCKLREGGWCSEYNERSGFGYFEFVWCSPSEAFEPEVKKCNCKGCFQRFSEEKK